MSVEQVLSSNLTFFVLIAIAFILLMMWNPKGKKK